MFVTSTSQVGVSQRVVATLVACAVGLTSVGLYNTAQAANLTNVSNTLSDSEPSVTSSHTISFTVPAGSVGIGAGDAVTITFDSQDDGIGGQDFAGIGAVAAPNISGTAPAGAVTFDSATADTIVVDGIIATAGETVEIVVADSVITNPATVGSYEIEIAVANTDNDIGRTRVAIVENVLVTAIVDTVFDFTISGLATTTDVNGEATTGSTTATAIDFAQLVPNTPEVLGQRLNVTTNAINGFVVTVEQDDDLRSSTGADIDSFIEGAYTNTPAVWPGALTNDISDENTWGHWGLTSDDADLNGDEFGSQLFVAASTTPREVFSHAGPSDGTSANIGSTTVAYKIEISPLQEAGDDYNTTLTYIATPTF